MARRYCLNEQESESDRLEQSSASLAGIVKLQPNRMRVHKSWRPMQNSNLEEAQRTVPEDAKYLDSSEPPSLFANISDRPTHDSSTLGSGLISKPNPHTVSKSPKSSTAMAQIDTNDYHTELFGNLPDPIRLHEQLGEFDGQVVFIGHPNRDVTAHQWSSSSYQWENIGRYAHSRAKIEGALVSDQIKESDALGNTLKSFKHAAENREKLIVEKGRSKPQAIDVAPRSLKEVLRTAASSKARASTSEGASGFPYRDFVPRQAMQKGAATTSTPVLQHETIKGEHLDDPFVAKTIPPGADATSLIQNSNLSADVKGSLDLAYEFPARLASLKDSRPMPLTAPALCGQYMQGELEKHTVFRKGAGLNEPVALPNFRDAAFSDEDENRYSFPGRQDIVVNRNSNLRFPEIFGSRLKLKDEVSGCVSSLTHLGTSAQGYASVPRIGGQQPTARSLYPSLGLTVANPHRAVPHQDRTPSISSNLPRLIVPQPDQQLKAAASNVDTAPRLFNDSGDIGQTQEDEASDVLSRQAPSVQNFKGPFFTNPLAYDPVVLLSADIREENKLKDWFRDGHRPARQREHAKALISTAMDNGKRQYLGVGEVMRTNYKHQFENTGPFVRLYENLSEYYEDYRNGSGNSYFTRAWAPAPLHLRDVDRYGNNSYFTEVKMDSQELFRHSGRH